MNNSWWAGTRLVAGRAISDAVASRSWRTVTVLMLLLGIALVVVPRLVGGGPPVYILAAVQGTDPQVTQSLQAAGEAAGFGVEITTVPDAAAAQAAVRDGDADAGLVPSPDGGTLYVPVNGSGAFPALVTQSVLAQSINRSLLDAGLTQAEINTIQSVPPPAQIAVGTGTDEGRTWVGYVVGFVLYLALILTGTAIATAVAVEKSTRISEVLLAVLRPSQLLVGTVAGVGLLSLLQIALLGVPAIVSLQQGDFLPSAATGDVALAVVWFVLGILLYAFVFAALATLVEKVTEIGAVTTPVNIVLIGSFLLGVSVGLNDPNGWASVTASLVPFSAPMVMPIRWASGLVPGWQLVLSMGLTAATAVLLAAVASRIYARGLTMAGGRLKLREALRG